MSLFGFGDGKYLCIDCDAFNDTEGPCIECGGETWLVAHDKTDRRRAVDDPERSVDRLGAIQMDDLFNIKGFED